jgi:carbon-monoxide dehydrogenase medium subunit
MHSPFRILRPTTLAEASRELRRYGEAARVYAGGSELLLLLRHGLVDCDYLVDVKQIPELARFEWDGRVLHIGAGITHRQLEQSPVVREHVPVLAEVEAKVANVRVRNIGTIGGNLCFSDPHSDPGTLMLVYDATVELRRGRARRRMPLEDLWLGSYETVLEPDELLATVNLPALPPGMAAAYDRVERYERPSVGIAAAAAQQGGRLTGVRLAVGCVGPKPIRLHELEGRLIGLRLDEAQRAIREAQAEIAALLEPVDDIHGSVGYKNYIVPVLLGRTLERATERAGDRNNG